MHFSAFHLGCSYWQGSAMQTRAKEHRGQTHPCLLSYLGCSYWQGSVMQTRAKEHRGQTHPCLPSYLGCSYGKVLPCEREPRNTGDRPMSTELFGLQLLARFCHANESRGTQGTDPCLPSYLDCSYWQGSAMQTRAKEHRGQTHPCLPSYLGCSYWQGSAM